MSSLQPLQVSLPFTLNYSSSYLVGLTHDFTKLEYFLDRLRIKFEQFVVSHRYTTSLLAYYLHKISA